MTTETDDDLKAAFLAETDDDRRWDLLVDLHERGWAYRPFNHDEPFAPRRSSSPEMVTHPHTLDGECVAADDMGCPPAKGRTMHESTESDYTPSVAEVVRRHRMVPYPDDKGDWLFRAASADEIANALALAGIGSLSNHREEWASYIEGWLGAVGPESPTVEGIVAALRLPAPPFGTAAPEEGAT